MVGLWKIPPSLREIAMRLPSALAPLLPLSWLLTLATGAGLAAEPGTVPARPLLPVKVIQNVTYYEGKDADPKKHCLDLYLPADRTGFPVLFYVHGGGWTIGDKNEFGVPGQLGRSLARQGIGMVSVNYRLSPAVKHPEHIRDVAQAFAWTYRNISKYGGRPDELFVSGHSAGGHLIALLATDESYLKAAGLSFGTIRGAIPISGVFRIDAKQTLFRGPFGQDPDALRQASPITHVARATPPFLILHADRDFPHCDGPAAQAFCTALMDQGAKAQVLEIPSRNHITVLWQAAASADDPAHRALVTFILSNVALHRLGEGDRTDGFNLIQEYVTEPLLREVRR
jgi:acetyl esterase/lipase